MFCSHCGSQIGENDRFCPGCGKAVNTATEPKATTFAQNQTVVHCTTYSAQPITYESRLVPILRHPLFFISALIFLAVSIYDFILWLPVLPLFFERLELYIFDFLRAVVLLGSNLICIIGLLLLAIGGLTKHRGSIGAALSLHIIALCLRILALALHMPNVIENASYIFGGFGYYDYNRMLPWAAHAFLVVPVHLLMVIFALRANSIARAMNNGQNVSLGSGPAIMLLIYAVLDLLVEYYTYAVSGYSLTYFFENYGFFLLAAISFGILLLLKRKNKQ